MNALHKIYIHIDQVQTRTPNGGFVLLSQLAYQLARYGYNVAVFDHRNRLFKEHFEWLQLPEPWGFRIAPIEEVLKEQKVWIITSLLRGWFTFLVENADNIGPRLLYWCHDELLHLDASPYRDFVRTYVKRIAITNDWLTSWYERLGFPEPFILRLWVRDEFTMGEGERPHLLGCQTTHEVFESAQYVMGNHASPLLCNGKHLEVRDKMRTCRWFLHWKLPKALVFEGEGFGLALLEAMACGAVPILRPHPGIEPLGYIYPQIITMLQLPHIIEDQAEFEALYRESAQALIEDHFRFDLWRVQVLERYMEAR